MKKIVLIVAHPDSESYNHALANSYKKGAQETHQVEVIKLADLQFESNLTHGYRKRTPLEPDLEKAIQQLKDADHLVWFFPLWWYSYPAIMKAFIDRCFLPGIMFQPVEGKAFPKGLLKGKTARIIMTSDTPNWYHRWFMKWPAINQLKKGTLQFCGIKNVKVSSIAVMKNSTEDFRKQWLEKVFQLGKSAS